MESGNLAPPSKLLLVVVILTILVAALLPFNWPRVAPPAEIVTRVTRTSYPESLQDGDLVFRLGRDALSALVLAQRKGSSYSHVGMLVRTGGVWSVFHSTPAGLGGKGGVHAEPLDSFASHKVAAKVAFFRVKGLTAALSSRVREYLLFQVDKPFDYRFEYSDDSAQYCTELVLKALRKAGIDLESSIDRVHIITLPEAAIPPDNLLISPQLHELTPNNKIQKTNAKGEVYDKTAASF